MGMLLHNLRFSGECFCIPIALNGLSFVYSPALIRLLTAYCSPIVRLQPKKARLRSVGGVFKLSYCLFGMWIWLLF